MLLDGVSLIGRRALLPVLAAALAGGPARPALSAPADLSAFKDTRYGVSFGVPEGWTAVPQELSDGRRLVLATDPNE
jgi:hypothetical protein